MLSGGGMCVCVDCGMYVCHMVCGGGGSGVCVCVCVCVCVTWYKYYLQSLDCTKK